MRDYAGFLRGQIRARAEVIASANPGLSFTSRGVPPTVLFRRASDGRAHPNFHREVWAAVSADQSWAWRLAKPHSHKLALPEEFQAATMELDSSNSSDALLMNVFCYPGAVERISTVLGNTPNSARPDFGYAPKIALVDGTVDTTEVDMLLGDTLVEAKLTESDFTTRPKPHVFRYKALSSVFDVHILPGDEASFSGYQLIRNVLAADQLNARLVVLMDFRRPDLLQEWWTVHAAIHSGPLRARCRVVFWQQLAECCGQEHRRFLEDKYGV